MANGLSLKVTHGEISLPRRVTSLCSPMKGKVAQSSPTLCKPVDCSLPGYSVLGILQARIQEWVVIFSPGTLPNPGIEPRKQMLISSVCAR